MTSSTFLTHLRENLRADGDQQPLYVALRDSIEAVIRQGTLADGSTLPSERALADALDLSRDTVRRAFEDLASRGVLVRAARSRSRVAPRVEKSLDSLASFTEEVRARHMTPSTRWLARRTVRADRNERQALELQTGERVIRLERLREADGVPVAIERASVPSAVLSSPALVEDSLYQALGRVGALPHRQRQRIRAESAIEADARLLECEPNTPLLVIERVCHARDGRAVERTVTRYNGLLHALTLESAPD